MTTDSHFVRCYFRHDPPLFANHPHIIMQSGRALPDIIESTTGSIVRFWPLTSPFEVAADTLGRIDWNHHTFRQLVQELCSTASGHWSTQFCLFCDSRVVDDEIARRFPLEQDDLWDPAITFVKDYNWIAIPDEQGIYLVFLADRWKWISDIESKLTNVGSEWSRFATDDSGSKFIGFLARHNT